MIFKVTVEVADKMEFEIAVPNAGTEEKAPGCKATTWGTKWPKEDKCSENIACPRCAALRIIERDIIPERDGADIKFDKLEPIVDPTWAIGGGDADDTKN